MTPTHNAALMNITRWSMQHPSYAPATSAVQLDINRNASSFSWSMVVMPFIERMEIHSAAFTRFAAGTGMGYNDATGWRLTNVQLPDVRCPSDFRTRPPSLVGSLGNCLRNGGDNWRADSNRFRGSFHFDNPPHITDGLSKTVMLGEVVVGEESTDRRRGTAYLPSTSYRDNVNPMDCVPRRRPPCCPKAASTEPSISPDVLLAVLSLTHTPRENTHRSPDTQAVSSDTGSSQCT